MILVIGATGALGGDICHQLAAAGKPVRALVRTTSEVARVDALRRLGVELTTGDLKDRESLDAACRGVAAVISTANAIHSRQPGDSFESVDLEGQIRLIDAARAAGVGHFVFVSVSGRLDRAAADEPVADAPLTAAKRRVEAHLRESGLTYTILRPTYFMEVWLGPALGFDIANARARIFGAGEQKSSWISRRDVARFAVDALDDPAARNATIELGGPEALSPLEVVRLCERMSGRRFEVQQIPHEALCAQWEGATDPHQRTFVALMLGVSRGDAVPMDDTLRRFPRQLISVREYVSGILSVGNQGRPAPATASRDGGTG